MKHKNGGGKRKPRLGTEGGAEKAAPNFVSPSLQDDFSRDDFDGADFDSRMVTETSQNGRRVTRQQAAKLSKKARRTMTASSMGFASSSVRPVSDAEQVCERTCPKDPNSSCSGTQYKAQELKAALEVIREVMKMDAAEPFNVPVDPTALGIPDYFDIIDTPMDFGTICSNLENGIKYKSLNDVFSDVQYIWDNCCKYNKKGHYILELMKRVKRNFTKLWTEAGLHRDQQQEIGANLLKKARSTMTASSMGFASASVKPISDAEQIPGERMYQNDGNSSYSVPQHKTHELKAALGVIREVMKMDAAEPFKCPVDPVALGILDYFDVIDTPMDFGTICCNLENGIKYKTSKDVLRDVQYIWVNCCKYNKKGHYVLELMKRVKRNFTKIWTEAGLYWDQQQEIEGPVHVPPTTSQSGIHGPRTPLDSMAEYARQQQQNLSRLQSYLPQQRPCQPQQSSEQQQTSRLQVGRNVGTPGQCSCPPPEESMIRSRKRGRPKPVDIMADSVSLQEQDQIATSHVQPHECQQRTFHGQLNPLSPSQPQDEVTMGNAESMIRNTKRAARFPAVRMTELLKLQQQDQTSPSQMQSHQPQLEICQGCSSRPCQSSQPQVPMELATADSSSTRRKNKGRGRGPTRCLNLWNRRSKIVVSTNEFGQPIGPEAPKLTNFLGTIARDGHLSPLNYVDWRAVPDENKEIMWNHVQAKFDIDPESKHWVLKSIGNKWKNFKAQLKAAHYNPHKTDEERLADRDGRVLPDQWQILVTFWSSKEAQERSATNKTNRSKMKTCHTTGTKSFARVREEERVRRLDGKEPSRAELFILTRTRKDGQPVNEASSAIISQLKERAAEKEGTSENGFVDDNVFFEVMGEDRHGRVRTYGLGPVPSDLGGPKPNRAEAMKMVSEANAEVREMKERMVAMEHTCAQMAAQMETMISMMSNMQNNNVADISGNSGGSQQMKFNSSSIQKQRCEAKSAKKPHARGKVSRRRR